MKFIKKNIIFQALDQSASALLIVDAASDSHPVVFANAAITEVLGLDPTDVVGCHFNELLAEGCWAVDTAAPAVTVDQHKWNGSEGPTPWLDVQIAPLWDPADHVAFWMISVVQEHVADVAVSSPSSLRSELRDAQREIRSLQRTDAVTGLANISTFDEILQRDWAIARREQRRIGVIVFEVDDLQAYRDTFGRHATDSLLRKIGHALNGTLRRAGDLAARLDDGRFTALIGTTDEEHIDGFAQRIASKVRNLAIHHPRSTHDRFVTLSFAAASEIPDPINQTNNLVAQALEKLAPDEVSQPADVAEDSCEVPA